MLVVVLRMIIVAGLVILAGLIVAGKIHGDPPRNGFERYQDGIARIMILMFIVAALGETVWSPIKCLVIPVFGIGGFYILYDAFLRKR